ncbi:3-ketodihydrosphingosine reductase tsc10 [Penicillium diatomitis]|uniref:3-dehydrosphinganine reductase n=1 Tax=Penicillium diatomitis TaxID=2819901 RepID=A0A9W9XFA8_9EURO|nr:3-ketodihydrosphingosine reductase tsc10 [Penicillium diatomitis]KAJ5491214.1 3-ketodihydrosphingosine reductase tsc10 [Penicillium diatomitis]
MSLSTRLSTLHDIPPSLLGVSLLACVAIAYTITKMLGFGRKNEFPVEGRTILITGGSDGTGRALAIQLAAKGAHVAIVARTVSKLQSTVQELQTEALHPVQQRFHYISADLIDNNECERVMAEVTEWNDGSPPDIVFCCAGFCLPGFFADVPIATQRQQMDTVYWTAANMAHATLRKWLTPIQPSNQTKTPRRHLIFCASVVAFAPIAGYGPYSAAKAALRSLSDTLSQEVEMYNGAYSQRHREVAPAADVKIHTLFPMGILTPGYDNEQQLKPALTKKLEESDRPQTPEEVARITIAALERGEYLITTMLMGNILKGFSLGLSPRNGLIGDTLIGWLSNLVALQVIPDLRKKAFNWGQSQGLPKPVSQASASS